MCTCPLTQSTSLDEPLPRIDAMWNVVASASSKPDGKPPGKAGVFRGLSELVLRQSSGFLWDPLLRDAEEAAATMYVFAAPTVFFFHRRLGRSFALGDRHCCGWEFASSDAKGSWIPRESRQDKLYLSRGSLPRRRRKAGQASAFV